MAGRGPAPKAPEQRQRRNKTPAATELPADGYQGEHPPLPDTFQVGVNKEGKANVLHYLDATREWYAAWTSSPMAAEFTAIDWQRLKMVAPIVDLQFRKPDKGLLAEIRLQESLLGGTVLDRHRMNMRLAKGEEEKPRTRKARMPKNDPRQALRVIEGGG